MPRDDLPGPVNHSGKQKITLLVLVIVALGAVFLLPGYVSEPWIVGDIDGRSAAEDSSPSSVSPSTAAEKTRYRQESQSVLAQIIAIRDRLESQNVTIWAEQWKHWRDRGEARARCRRPDCRYR